ncbi:hypothetical protein M422DRAFT_217261 [Sphaerobolus stellatus SS14]|uniref:Lectin n=1 Tax=Sphaerobolus stellatus (strain SS14) TaxID=990650 RepID=A0A0C9UFA9_SPHS4|nr:hypothetical protein M422DRAFT_217261 [Sphaerobolus stellatus SS14]
MSKKYTVTVNVNDVNDKLEDGTINNISRRVWHYANGGNWSSQSKDQWKLTMGGSGTCGTLRFDDSVNDEHFFVLIGVHNYKRWCDIVTDEEDSDLTKLLSQYYDDNYPHRTGVRWKQRSKASATTDNGTKIKVKFTKDDGHDLKVELTIE